MDAATLAEAMGNATTMARYEQLVGPFNEAMLEAEITNVNRAAMWCAQIGHESIGLLHLEEIADGSEYEGRSDLGNTQPGDGTRFKGRGPIQVTGRNNYTEVSRWAFEWNLVPTETYFGDNPEALAEDEYIFLGAVWYWTVSRPQLNALSDEQNLDAVTYQINGGYNGLEDRRQRYSACLALGESLLPENMSIEDDDEEELDMAAVDEIKEKLDLIMDQLAGPGRNEDGGHDYSG